MAVLKVIRKNDRCNIDTMDNDISYMWNKEDIYCRDYTGVPDDSTEGIIEAFRMVQNAFGKNYGIRSHMFQIEFIELFTAVEAWEILLAVLGYQILILWY